MPQFRVTLGFLSSVSLLPSAPHLIPLPSSKRFTIHPLVFYSWICCAISPLYFHKVFTEISKPRHGNGRKKERKSNIEHSLCVLQRSSTIHFENILLIERIMVVIVARGGLEGLLVSKRPQSLQAIFNWTLIRHLPGSSSFWSWRRSWQQRACLKARGRLVLYFNTCQLMGRQRDTLLLHSLHAKLQSTTGAIDRPSILLLSPPSRLPPQITRRPDKMKCHR